MDQSILHPYKLPSTATKMVLSERNSNLSMFVSTWDGKIQCLSWNSKFNHIRQLQKFDLSKSNLIPILGLAVGEAKLYYSCEGDDGKDSIFEIDLNSKSDPIETTLIGKHSAPINHLMLLDNKQLCSFSWDGYCNIWDLRHDDGPIAKHKLQYGGNVIDIKKHNDTILGIVGGDKLFTLNGKDVTQEPAYFSLKGLNPGQTMTSISIDPYPETELEFSVGTIDGRVIYAKKDPAKADLSQIKSQWRCHYHESSPHTVVYPVKSLVHHPSFEKLLFSGGDDGRVNFHDMNRSSAYKKDLFKDTVPVTHVDISPDGFYVVAAKGYGWRSDKASILSSQAADSAQIVLYTLADDDMPAE